MSKTHPYRPPTWILRCCVCRVYVRGTGDMPHTTAPFVCGQCQERHEELGIE